MRRSRARRGTKPCYRQFAVNVHVNTIGTSDSAISSCRARVLTCVRRYGEQTTAFQVLEHGYEYWFDAVREDACVAYRLVGRTRVAAGAPLADRACLAEVAARFCESSAADGHRVVWFGVDESFLGAARSVSDRVDALTVGREPIWDLRAEDDGVPPPRYLRSQCRRAERKGVRVRRLESIEVDSSASRMRRRVLELVERWVKTRPMPPMDFLVRVDPFSAASQRRYYVATRGEELVGCLVAVPIPSRAGWFFENIIRDPGAPNGTVESLLCAALGDARRRGDEIVSLGLSPLAGVDKQLGPHRALRVGLRLCYEHLGALYRFRGLHEFKARMRPHRWEPRYLVVADGRVGLGSLLAVLRAFAGGSLLRFGARVLRHQQGRALCSLASACRCLAARMGIVPRASRVAATACTRQSVQHVGG